MKENEDSVLSPQGEVACKSPVEKDLHVLVAENNYMLLESLLEGELQSSIEQLDKHKQTPLNLAARLGHHQVVKVGGSLCYY